MCAFNSKQQEEPLHSGEVYHLWTYLYNTKGFLVTLQVLMNHTGDDDLKAYLEDFNENSVTEEEKQVETFLKETGIRLPPAPPDRPNVELQDIPAGARFNDPEIAVLIQKELMTSKLMCSYIMSMCAREDIGSMFEEFHTQKAEYEGRLLKLSKEKGWLVPPPINVK